MIPEKLKAVKENLGNGEKVEPISVRTFLNWYWGSQRRGWWIVKVIRESLAEAGLETFPDFSSAYIDSLIEFRKTPKTEKKNGTKKKIDESDIKTENIAEKSTDEVLNLDDPTYRLSRLEAANKNLIFVKT